MNPSNSISISNTSQSEAELESELSEQQDSDEEGIPNIESTPQDQDPDPECPAPLHRPMPTAPPGRPCLKRTSSASPVRERGASGNSAFDHSASSFLVSGRRSASEGNHSFHGYGSDSSSNGESGSGSDGNSNHENGKSSRFPFNCSFDAPRRFCSQKKTVQQVRFESSPQAYLTHSSTNYDRTPIKCTKGSEFDLSMPPRCSNQEESDEEADDEGESSAIKRMGEEENERPRLDYFGRWVNLKRGTIIGGIKDEDDSPASTLSKLYQSSSSPPLSPSKNTCALPHRGVRSFGGLCSKHTSPEEVESALQASSTSFDSAINDDATPMPSPSVRKTLAQPLARGLDSGRMHQSSQSQSTSGSYFDLDEADLGDSTGGDYGSGTETIKEADGCLSERMRESGNQPSSFLSACDLDWTLVPSTSYSSRNGDTSPIHSSRSSRSHSREEDEPLSAEACSEIEAVRQMLRKHALENGKTRSLGSNAVTSPLHPMGPQVDTFQDQNAPSGCTQSASLPVTPAADETSSSSSSCPYLEELSFLPTHSGQSSNSNHECASSPISFFSSDSTSSVSSLASSPMSSRSSSLENWMNPILSSGSLNGTKKENGEAGTGNGSVNIEDHHQRFTDPGLTSSCNTSVSGSDDCGTESPPTNDSSSAASPELLPLDCSGLKEFKNGIKMDLNDGYPYGLIERLNSVQRNAESEGGDSGLTISSQDAKSGCTSPTLSQLDDAPPPKSKSRSSSSSTKKKGSGSKCKAKREREEERERERVRELLGEEADCLGGF